MSHIWYQSANTVTYVATGQKPPVGEWTRAIAGILLATFDAQNHRQRQFAITAGISQSQLSKYLRGVKSPNIDELEMLCTLMGLDLVDLLIEADEVRRRP